MYNSQSPLISISLIHNEHEYNIYILPKHTVYDLYNIIITKFNINISLYELIFNDQLLPPSKLPLIHLLSLSNTNNEKVVFTLRKKGSPKSNDMFIILIEHIPSYGDFLEQISYFFNHIQNPAENKYKIEYRQHSNQSKVVIYDENIANSLVQYLNTLKQCNDSYSKVNVNLSSLSTGVEYSTLNYNTSIVIPVKCENTNKKRNKKEYFNEQKYVRNSSPYLSREDNRKFDEKLNRQKWITPEGFISSVGNYSSVNRDIKNYVNNTPSESPLLHKFRPVNKEKWINKKGFY